MMKPVIFEWDGEVMVPWPRFVKLCNAQYVVGEDYRLDVMEDRSTVSHNHYFASLSEAWKNLPEDIAERFPSTEYLRKWALVKAGYADERTFVCSTKTEAQNLAAFLRPLDQYAVIVVKEKTVKVYNAQSQSTKAMGAKEFQDSKQKVLDIIAGLIGVQTETLNQSGEPHA